MRNILLILRFFLRRSSSGAALLLSDMWMALSTVNNEIISDHCHWMNLVDEKYFSTTDPLNFWWHFELID